MNPYRADADRLRAIANKLHGIGTVDHMANAFPLGGGFGYGSQRLRDRKIEARIKRATEAVKAEAKAVNAERMADAFDRGEPTDAEKAEKRREVMKRAKELAKERDNTDRKNMPDSERLGIFQFPGGVAYCDRAIEKSGDYKRLAFLPRKVNGPGYDPIRWDAIRFPSFLRAAIEASAQRHCQEANDKEDVFGLMGELFRPA
jgi:hypothetical protein